MSFIDKPERARQLARAIASDLMVYHDKEIQESIKQDQFFEKMHDLIEEGRTLFQRRVSPEINPIIYDHALLDVILKAYESVECPLW